MKNKKGFTLVEMITVLAIIGILTSIVIVSLDKVRSQSRDKKRMGDIKSLQLALENYYNRNGRYPNSLNDLVTPGVLAALPVDPSTNSTTTYKYSRMDKATKNSLGNWIWPGSCLYYHLAITLENNMQEYLDSDADIESTMYGTVPQPGRYWTGNCGGPAVPYKDSRYIYDVAPKY